MDFLVDDILRIKCFWAIAATPYDRTLNVFHYRCTTAASGVASTYDAIWTAFKDEVVLASTNNMTDVTFLAQVRIAVVSPIEKYEQVWDWTPSDFPGQIDSTLTSTAHMAAACLTRRSYVPKRQGIGRTFFGPLALRFIVGDQVVIDPVGGGDLEDVKAAYDAILSPTASGVWHPNIWGPLNPSAGVTAASRDQRTSAWAPLWSRLETRKPGRGS